MALLSIFVTPVSASVILRGNALAAGMSAVNGSLEYKFNKEYSADINISKFDMPPLLFNQYIQEKYGVMLRNYGKNAVYFGIGLAQVSIKKEKDKKTETYTGLEFRVGQEIALIKDIPFYIGYSVGFVYKLSKTELSILPNAGVTIAYEFGKQ